MHAYLFIGNSKEDIDRQINKLFPNIKDGLLNQTIAKIEDVGTLRKSLKLAAPGPLYIKINNIDSATIEAQNAFLKNLEEPPTNVWFLLAAKSEANILPTILSRCEVIKTSDNFSYPKKELSEFFEKDTCDRILTLGKITKKDEAIEFLTFVIFYLHDLLKENKSQPELPHLLKAAGQTLANLKLNGNVFLQLLNFAVNAK